MCFKHIPQPRTESEKVSPETLRRRNSCITQVATTQHGPGGQNYYIAEVIRRKGKKEREVLLCEMGLGGEMTEEEGIAMMVDLGATWNMIRKLRR